MLGEQPCGINGIGHPPPTTACARLTASPNGWYNSFRVINSSELGGHGDSSDISPRAESQKFQAANPSVPVIEVLAPNAPFPLGVDPPPTPEVCSYHVCLAGHKWPMTLAVTKCPGCASSLLAVQKTQCPFCNEPCVRSVLRSDFVVRGGGISARCTGQPVQESLDIEMARSSWEQAEATAEPFLVREAREREGGRVI